MEGQDQQIHNEIQQQESKEIIENNTIENEQTKDKEIKEETWDTRTKLLVGNENYEIIQKTSILLLGNHPSFSFASEYLIRAGVMKLTLYYPEMNTNTQHSLHAFSVNQRNEQDQLLEINPQANIQLIQKQYNVQLMRTHISSNDIILIGIEEEEMLLNAIQIAFELKKKIFVVVGGYGIHDSSKIMVKPLNKIKKGDYMLKLKEKLTAVKIYRKVKLIYTEDGFAFSSQIEENKMNQSFSFVFGVMGTFVAGEAINSIIVRKPVQTRAIPSASGINDELE